MALMRFLRRDAIKRLLHLCPAVAQFVAKRRPHLEDAIREAELENRAGDRWIRTLVTEVNMLPGLRAARLVLHNLQSLRIFGGVGHGTLGANDPDEPAVSFARSNPLCLNCYRESVIFLIDLAKDRRIIPRPARNERAFAIRAFPHDFAELRMNVRREPAEPEGNMQGVHSQIPHTTILSVKLDHPLPIDRLLRI